MLTQEIKSLSLWVSKGRKEDREAAGEADKSFGGRGGSGGRKVIVGEKNNLTPTLGKC